MVSDLIILPFIDDRTTDHRIADRTTDRRTTVPPKQIKWVVQHVERRLTESPMAATAMAVVRQEAVIS